jgi:hypothetical protein
MDKLTIRSADFSVESDDLIKVTLFDGIEFDMSDADELLNALKQLTAGRKYYVLTRTYETFTVDSDVRQYLAENIASAGIIANAICIKSLPIRFIINAYIKFNKPNIPTKTFNTENVALEWIDDIRKSNLGKENAVSTSKSKNLMY